MWKRMWNSLITANVCYLLITCKIIVSLFLIFFIRKTLLLLTVINAHIVFLIIITKKRVCNHAHKYNSLDFQCIYTTRSQYHFLDQISIFKHPYFDHSSKSKDMITSNGGSGSCPPMIEHTIISSL